MKAPIPKINSELKLRNVLLWRRESFEFTFIAAQSFVIKSPRRVIRNGMFVKLALYDNVKGHRLSVCQTWLALEPPVAFLKTCIFLSFTENPPNQTLYETQKFILLSFSVLFCSQPGTPATWATVYWPVSGEVVHLYFMLCLQTVEFSHENVNFPHKFGLQTWNTAGKTVRPCLNLSLRKSHKNGVLGFNLLSQNLGTILIVILLFCTGIVPWRGHKSLPFPISRKSIFLNVVNIPSIILGKRRSKIRKQGRRLVAR